MYQHSQIKISKHNIYATKGVIFSHYCFFWLSCTRRFVCLP
uniref:Uncharacterized protein n=1 Tax=Arundo donax TaxID=35708 RepID=A0A0A8ZDY4_ARUDO